jgi:hypothetical protein
VSHNALIVISAALGGCVVLLAVLLGLVGRWSRRSADGRVEAVVQILETRMDELAQELAGAVGRAEEEGRRSRFLGEIAGSIDMDEVLGRTLDAGTRLDGVDAALIRIDAAGTRGRRSQPTGSSRTAPRRSPARPTGAPPGRSRSPTATRRAPRTRRA